IPNKIICIIGKLPVMVVAVPLVYTWIFPNNANCRPFSVYSRLIDILGILITAEVIVHEFKGVVLIYVVKKFSEKVILVGLPQAITGRYDLALSISKNSRLLKAPVENIAESSGLAG